VRTIGDVGRVGEPALAARLGADAAARLGALARGDDARAVEPERAAVSIGSEDTFDHDVHGKDELVPGILAQADRACARARAAGLRARVVVLKVKLGDHTLLTRRTTLPRPTADGRVVGRAAAELLGGVPAVERRGVRLTGVTLTGLDDADAPRQLDFDEPTAERGERLGATIDELRAKFGARAVQRAVHLDDDRDEDEVPRGRG
jgi:DNA polymerase-4